MKNKNNEPINTPAGHYDPLTQLPDRYLFQEKLNECSANKFELLIINIADFKSINHALGYSVGDALLSAVGNRLKNVVPNEYIVSRFTGDEFAILVPDIKDVSDAECLAQTVLDHLSQPFIIEDHEIDLRVRIGISICPDDHEDKNHLIKNAHLAMTRGDEAKEPK